MRPAKNKIEIAGAGQAAAAKVRALRNQRGLNQRDLSRLLDATGRPMLSTVISKIERGERRIDVDDLFALAAAFGITPAQLLEPPEECSTCHGSPPPGFTCRTCGTEADQLIGPPS